METIFLVRHHAMHTAVFANESDAQQCADTRLGTYRHTGGVIPVTLYDSYSEYVDRVEHIAHLRQQRDQLDKQIQNLRE